MAKKNPFVPAASSPVKRRIVKGIAGMNASVDTHADFRSLKYALRRRRLGLLDEQTLKKRKATHFPEDRRGPASCFVTEFLTPPSDNHNPGFQCVARKSIDDFTATPNRGGGAGDDGDDASSSTKFNITLRHIPPQHVDFCAASVKNVARDGFLNYYYGPEVMGPHVRHGLLPGLLLLQGHHAAAFELICQAPRVLQQKLLRYDEQDEEFAVKKKKQENESMSSRQERRKQLLQQLNRNNKHHQDHAELQNQLFLLEGGHRGEKFYSTHGLAKALEKFKPLELTDPLCENVFQSVLGVEGCSHLVQEFAAVVWNECLTRRVKRFGRRCLVSGDFVEENHEERDKTVHLREWCPASSSSSSQDQLTEEGNDLLHRIMLPTIGYATTNCSSSSSYINNNKNQQQQQRMWASFTRQALSGYGISFDTSSTMMTTGAAAIEHNRKLQAMFQSPLWNLPGEYRRMVEHPRDFKWSLTPDVELSRAELSTTSGFYDQHQKNHGQQRVNKKSSRFSPQQQPPPLLHKLELSFSLPAGVSPWMMIRELCKRERYIIDLGHQRALDKREESKLASLSEKAAIRNKIYRKIKHEHSWSYSMPEGLQTARLWQSVFTHKGIKGSLMPPVRARDDVVD